MDGNHYPDEPPSSFTAGGRLKRERDDGEEDLGLEEVVSNPPAAKRRRQTGPDLVSFYRPFPCAFGGRCNFRDTCSYHHGDPTPCGCDDAFCPRGHAHRRAPKPCDHGPADRCRWNLLKECSHHHGDPRNCDCDDVSCARAHPRRVHRNAELREAKKREHPQWKERAEKNARRLYVGLPPNAQLSVSEIHTWFGDILRDNTNNGLMSEDPILGVQIDQEKRFAFVELRSVAVATACLALDGTNILGRGRVDVQRPKDFDPSVVAPDNSSPAFGIDTSKLCAGEKKKKGAGAGKKKKGKEGARGNSKTESERYRKWRKEEKARSSNGETNGELRKRYLELFPERR